MSYYDKYLKYKNKYLQYKNSLRLNMQGGNPPEHPPAPVNTRTNNILHINNLTATPTNNDGYPKTYRHNKLSSIERLSDTPRMSEFAGGAYKRKIKSKYEQDRLLKLLEKHDSPINSHSGDSEISVPGQIRRFKKDPHKITDNHRYFATSTDSSSSSSTDSLGI
jgi:hypothetical protein